MQNWSILAKFAKRNPAKSAVFYWLFLGDVSSLNFPWNPSIFLRICPWKSFEIWLSSAKIPRNQPIFLRILTFSPRNWPIFPQIFTLIPRNRPIFPRICPWKSYEILLFFARNIRSPVYSVRGIVSHPWWCRWSEQFYKVLSVSQLTISSVKANNCYNV